MEEEGGNRKSKGGGQLLLPPSPSSHPSFEASALLTPSISLGTSPPPFFFLFLFSVFSFFFFLFCCFSVFFFVFSLFSWGRTGVRKTKDKCAQHKPFRSPPPRSCFDAPLPSHFEASPIEAPLVFEAHLSFFFLFPFSFFFFSFFLFFCFFLFPFSVFFFFLFLFFLCFFLFFGFLPGGVNFSTA